MRSSLQLSRDNIYVRQLSKHYMTSQCYPGDGSEATSISGSTAGVAQQFDTGALPSFTVATVQWNLKMETGLSDSLTISCSQLSSSGTSIVTSDTTFSTSTLTTSYQTYDFAFSSPTISDGDMFAITLSSTPSAGSLVIKAGGDIYSNTQMQVKSGSTWSSRDRDCDMCLISGSTPPVTSTQLLPPPVAWI